MKKTLSVLTLTAAAWLGTTAYIGNNVESETKKFLSATQKKYKNMGMDLQVKIKEKSFFTSKAEVTLNYTDPSMKELVGAIYDLPLKLDYKIEHGPVFFKNGLDIGLVRTSSEKSIVSFLHEDLRKDLKLDEKDLIMASHSTIGFTKNMTTDISISPVNYNDDYLGIKSSALVGHFDFNLNTLVGTAELNLPSVKIYDLETPNQNFFSFKDSTIHMNIDKFVSDNVYLGDIVMETKEISIAFEDLNLKEPLVFNSKIDVNIDEDKDKDIKVVYKIDAEHLKGNMPKELIPLSVQPKKASLEMIIEGLSTQGLDAFQKYTIEIQKKTQALIEKMSKADPENRALAYADLGAFQLEMQEKMVELAQNLFSPKKAKITYNMSIEDENKKKNNVNLSLAYIGDKLTGSLDEITEKFMLNAFESFKADVDISIDESLITSVKDIMNDREKQNIDMGLMMGTAQGIINKEGSIYKVKAEYAPNKLILNGKDMSAMINMAKSSL